MEQGPHLGDVPDEFRASIKPIFTPCKQGWVALDSSHGSVVFYFPEAVNKDFCQNLTGCRERT